jgi:hypothetical protein
MLHIFAIPLGHYLLASIIVELLSINKQNKSSSISELVKASVLYALIYFNLVVKANTDQMMLKRKFHSKDAL